MLEMRGAPRQPDGETRMTGFGLFWILLLILLLLLGIARRSE